jgi:predicted nucleic acid-binding protein
VISAVDTSVLLDVFLPDERHGPRSKEWLRNAYDRGAILVCDVVYAELAPGFEGRSKLDEALREINVTISPIDTSIAYEAGLRWLRYRQAGGPRTRIISDFLIGAHAIALADAFITRDRGFYKTYFPELRGF